MCLRLGKRTPSLENGYASTPGAARRETIGRAQGSSRCSWIRVEALTYLAASPHEPNALLAHSSPSVRLYSLKDVAHKNQNRGDSQENKPASGEHRRWYIKRD